MYRRLNRPGAVHLATVAGAIIFWAWLDRHLWFFGDEWQFLLHRGVFTSPGSPDGLWAPHNEHWSTVPILLWRAIYNLWHLDSYWPYLVPLLLALGGVMHLAWRLCLRGGVDPWVATAAVALIGFLGPGAEDLAWAFQFGFVGSLLFGLAAWDVLDVPDPPPSPEAPSPGPGANQGRVDRRGVVAGLLLVASLMCSTIGDAMVAGAFFVLLGRRDLREALRVLALPILAWLVWFALIGHSGLSSPDDSMSLSTFTNLPSYIWSGFSTSLGQAFNISEAGDALVVALGACVLWRLRWLWEASPSLPALCVAAVVFFALAGSGRDALGTAIPSRYVFICIVLLVPVIAALLSGSSGWWVGRAACCVFLAATVLGDVGQAQTWVSGRQSFVLSLKTDVLAMAQELAQGARDVAGPGARPVPYEPDLTAANLGSLRRQGLLPHQALTPADLVNARTTLATYIGPSPLAPGKLVFIDKVAATRAKSGPGCDIFQPVAAGEAMQVRLEIAGGSPSASVQVSAPPAPTGSPQYLGAVLSPPGGPSSTQVTELEMPAGGDAYVSYNDRTAELVLFWTAGTALTLCDLADGGDPADGAQSSGSASHP